MAYALVISLKQTLEPHLDPSRSRLQIPESEVREIYDDLCYLKSFFDQMNSLKDSNNVEELEKEMKDVLQSIRDLIECHLSDLLLHSVSDISTAELVEELAEAQARLGSLIILLKAKEDYLTGVGQQSPAPPSVAPVVPISSKFGSDMIVGLEDEVMEVKELILRGDPRRLVMSITGIAGIGKTSLAQKVYLDTQIIDHFRIRLFLTMDFEYERVEVFLRLLSQLGFDEINEWDSQELALQLHSSLYGGSYLVILDDIRDIRAWNQLEIFFPNNYNGSAIMLTTSSTEAARVACSKENILPKRFLTNMESWELLCKMSLPEADNNNVSEREVPLAKLIKIGKTIAGKLLGLPLAVVEIGRLLSNMPATVENWEAVDRDVSQLIQEATIPKFLKPSYAELPHHLKACFLYFGLFPPNYNISTSQLFKLWAAEGFINVVRDEDERLEEKAEEYLEDLVSRSIVEVHERSSRGGIKSCSVPLHFHHLCVHEARDDKLFHVVKMGNGHVAQGRLEEQRRLGVHNNSLLGLKQVRNLMSSATDASSLLCVGSQHLRPLQLYLEFRRLRVLHAFSIRLWEFPNVVARLVGLKYLAITCGGELPSSISRLWNLETLIISLSQRVHPFITLPLEIWKLRKLRHLYCMGFDLPDPRDDEMGDSLFLDKLLALSGVSAGSCTAGVLSRMPRLIKIGIWFESTQHAADNLFVDDDPIFSHLHSLESFKCVSTDLDFRPRKAAACLIDFPSSLKTLNLGGCRFSWDLMTVIGCLPLLQVLKLRSSAFCSPRWTPVEEEFQSLKYLMLVDLDLEYMEVDSSCFPVLKHLIIKHCYKLREIPLEFEDIPTLSVIEVEDCSPAANESARKIRVEQRGYGFEKLRVVITSSWDDRWIFFMQQSERTLCCILQNSQKVDGIEIPEALRPFMGEKSFIPYKEDSKGMKKSNNTKPRHKLNLWIMIIMVNSFSLLLISFD